ncbi:MAG TPA: alpha/beta hydrolase [Cytophagaceae bacterium]|jgi:pimeloyl-ACP methyl ester carboxylesterase|nr:alpha/beta hydrolase [Cytophagaceae bacterium]
MERTFYFFHYKQASLHYSITGVGTTPLFCFHGFGQTGEIFYELEKEWQNKYTIYSFDLFFHGKSEWRAGEKAISDSFLGALIREFRVEKKISSFSLLGYSIGSKLAWSIVKQFPDKVKEIIVIAPDGITDSIWYRLATRSLIGSVVFKIVTSTKKISGILFAFGKILKILPPAVVKFAKSQLVTEEQRKQVYYTWIVLRKLKIEPQIIAGLINKNKIETTFYLGRYDKIIRYETIKPLAEKIEQKNIIILPSGHTGLVAEVKNYLSKKG